MAQYVSRIPSNNSARMNKMHLSNYCIPVKHHRSQRVFHIVSYEASLVKQFASPISSFQHNVRVYSNSDLSSLPGKSREIPHLLCSLYHAYILVLVHCMAQSLT